MIVIGMISGTSFDGIDVGVADIRFDGDAVVLRPLGAITHDYPPELRDAIASALPPNATSAAEMCALDTRIGQVFGLFNFERATARPAARRVGVTEGP